MIKRQNIDIQYLRLLGVTLLITAAYVSDAEGRDGQVLALDDVREIILDQIQHDDQLKAEQEIDWAKALETVGYQRRSSSGFAFFISKGYSIEVLSVSTCLPELPDAPVSMLQSRPGEGQLVVYADESVLFPLSFHCSGHPSRAGPLA